MGNMLGKALMHTLAPILLLNSMDVHSDPQLAQKPNWPIAEVAIIIDDIGYNKGRGLSAIALPGDITYAIIPHSPNAVFLAKHARQHQKERFYSST